MEKRFTEDERVVKVSWMGGTRHMRRVYTTTGYVGQPALGKWNKIGDAFGAYNSGRNLVTNAFVLSFWFLDQLRMSSVYCTKTHVERH
ncbi:hypothetical protein E3N88_38128 [Mikania micrantha]|uniref:Uncharacterized protein n=1 Tax=Mikania micrantha TaxID=192012 RepID=A0A5N6LT41_9ASTR|nr:hypothetical protein E3N88_38128 [Mikania micrantha]